MDRQFYEKIKHILETARQKAYSAANLAMVEAYWNIGRHIVERQGGDARAEYGAGLIKELSEQLTKDFGRGFTTTNLKYMRQFYLTFPNGHALCDQLSWSHYRLLMRVENANATYLSPILHLSCPTYQSPVLEFWQKDRLCAVFPFPL